MEECKQAADDNSIDNIRSAGMTQKAPRGTRESHLAYRSQGGDQMDIDQAVGATVGWSRRRTFGRQCSAVRSKPSRMAIAKEDKGNDWMRKANEQGQRLGKPEAKTGRARTCTRQTIRPRRVTAKARATGFVVQSTLRQVRNAGTHTTFLLRQCLQLGKCDDDAHAHDS